MAKKAQTVDDVIPFYTPADKISQELAALIASGIVTKDGDELIWREGQLEHVARVYAADPVQADRNYHDDVTVAKAYSGVQWESLVNAAKV